MSATGGNKGVFGSHARFLQRPRPNVSTWPVPFVKYCAPQFLPRTWACSQPRSATQRTTLTRSCGVTFRGHSRDPSKSRRRCGLRARPLAGLTNGRGRGCGRGRKAPRAGPGLRRDRGATGVRQGGNADVGDVDRWQLSGTCCTRCRLFLTPVAPGAGPIKHLLHT